ncbi:MAG: cardiolipin synthase [Gammaproteobacteria bacterium]|nr:cardiolipin synthase [Gammaproteobacteria bacterium]
MQTGTRRIVGWLAALAVAVVLPVIVVGRCSVADFGTAPDTSSLRSAQAKSEGMTRKELTAAEERFAGLEPRLDNSPLSAGNRVTLLLDGEGTYPAMLDAIAGARNHIHLETYIMLDDEVGNRFADALIARSRDGVAVRLIYDGFGGTDANDFWKRLTDAGVQVFENNPPEPTENADVTSYNNRDHRKILVVDGKIAFTGGINIYDVYANRATDDSGGSLKGSGASSPSKPKNMRWRDTHLRIEGPAVAELQKLFVAQWEQENGSIEDGDLYPKQRRMGRASVKILAGVGDNAKPSEIYAAYLNVIGKAEKRIWITQAYFVPNDEFMIVLREAAQRGVDVKIILPGKTDVALIRHASRALYGKLLEAGVQIFEFQDAILHAKTAVVDDVWSTVGSSNLDFRSFLINDEVNAVVIDAAFAGEMERAFLADLEDTRQITLESWKNRPLGYKLIEVAAGWFKPWI